MLKTRKSRLFNDASTRKTNPKIGYGTGDKARKTIRLLKGNPKAKQLINTLFFRAKYHKYQTKGMKEAQKIFGDWLIKH